MQGCLKHQRTLELGEIINMYIKIMHFPSSSTVRNFTKYKSLKLKKGLSVSRALYKLLTNDKLADNLKL